MALLIAHTNTPYAQVFEVELTSKIIENFKVGSKVKKFGKLEFIGGLEFTSSNQHVGAISGLAMMPDQSNFVAVTDTGYWFAARVERSANGKPAALAQGRMAQFLNATGKPFRFKWVVDAESIAMDGNTALVSFERVDRVLRYPLDLENFASRPQRVQLDIGIDSLPINKGLESVAVSPEQGPLKGATIVVSERSFAANGEIRAAIINGPNKGLFTVKRSGIFDITDADFLPNGDLLLLERRYNIARGVGMRIRRIAGEQIKPGASLEGEMIIEVGTKYQIDNMEGLSVSTNDKGEITLSLISDNNHSLLQRNLYLEFRLVE